MTSGRCAPGGPLPSADTACLFRGGRCSGRFAALSGHSFARPGRSAVPGGPLPSADDRVSLRATLHYIVGVAAEGSGPPGSCPQRTIEYLFERHLVVWPLRAAALPSKLPYHSLQGFIMVLYGFCWLYQQSIAFFFPTGRQNKY